VDACEGEPSESDVDPDQSLTLGTLVIPRGNGPLDWMVGDCEFEAEDHKIVELLLACSLFHLNSSRWLRNDWDMDSVMVFATPGAQNLLNRWRPYIECSLESVPQNRGDDNDDILSLGLLIMEMEAKRRALPTEEEKDWVTGLPSKDSLLKRVLTEWKRKLDDGYQQIGSACLRFRELAQKFYHPALPEDMKRTAAIYKYILVPLYRLITQSYRSTSQLFYPFPRPPQSSPASYLGLANQNWDSQLVLFDDSSWHNPE